MLLVFCARRVLDPDVAVDLTAESFALAFTGRRGFRGTTEVEARAWLLTIARRQIARYLKRGAMERSTVERLGIQVPRLDDAEAEEIERRAGLSDLRQLSGEPVKHPPAAAPKPTEGLGIVEPRSAVLTGLRVADPGGGPAWGLRTSKTTGHPPPARTRRRPAPVHRHNPGRRRGRHLHSPHPPETASERLPGRRISGRVGRCATRPWLPPSHQR